MWSAVYALILGHEQMDGLIDRQTDKDKTLDKFLQGRSAKKLSE
jgi:hypothetical protein